MAGVMMALGIFRFSIDTAPYENLRRRAQYRWARQNRAGRKPAVQFLGADLETVELSGVMYPGYSGGLLQMQALRELAGLGVPYILADGNGVIWGKFCIESVAETQTHFFADGTPRKIEFRIKLVEYGEDA